MRVTPRTGVTLHRSLSRKPLATLIRNVNAALYYWPVAANIRDVNRLTTPADLGSMDGPVIVPLPPEARTPTLRLAEEMFVIPIEQDFILYLPLIRKAVRVNADVITQLQRFSNGEIIEQKLREQLVRVGALVDTSPTTNSPDAAKDYCPTQVSLFPTNDCNLRCVYCYARAGTQHKVMPLEIARAAIDFIVTNAQLTKALSITVGFHGGGEPTFGRSWQVVTGAVEYARRRAAETGLKLRTLIVTNGVLSETKRNWLVANLNSISLSLDGPDDIQNRQRPLRNGGPTYSAVMKTIEYFEKCGFQYDVRVTVTNESVRRMLEIVQFIAENTSRRTVAIEPITVCGRCAENRVTEMIPDLFLTEFLKCRLAFPSIRLRYSACSLGRPRQTFCGACGKNFDVTPDGLVTACNEITEASNPLAGLFIFGRYDANRRAFEFDNDKIRRLLQRTVENIPFCRDCFAKYSCAGDCPVRVARVTGDIMDTRANGRCEISRGVLLCELETLTASLS